jgi:hypothetical protein
MHNLLIHHSCSSISHVKKFRRSEQCQPVVAHAIFTTEPYLSHCFLLICHATQCNGAQCSLCSPTDLTMHMRVENVRAHATH